MDKNCKTTVLAVLRNSLNIPDGLEAINCPGESDLLGYWSGSYTQESRSRIEKHLAHCEDCFFLLSAIIQAQTRTIRPIPKRESLRLIQNTLVTFGIEDYVKRAKRKGIKRLLPLALSLFFLAASFFIPRFFMQCLCMTLIFGLRWALHKEHRYSYIIPSDKRRLDEKQDKKPVWRTKANVKSFQDP